MVHANGLVLGMRSRLAVLLCCLLAGPLWVCAGNYQIDKSKSTVAVDARATPPHTFTSVAKDYQYDIQIEPGKLSLDKAIFSFKFEDLDSDNSKRDKKMRNWMEIGIHPKARFELGEVVEGPGELIGKGTYFMHGIEVEIEVPFSINRDGDIVTIDGTAEFNYEDWDLEIIKLFIFTVKPELKVHFHLEGSLSDGH